MTVSIRMLSLLYGSTQTLIFKHQTAW